jgi:hypothetical protein
MYAGQCHPPGISQNLDEKDCWAGFVSKGSGELGHDGWPADFGGSHGLVKMTDQKTES